MEAKEQPEPVIVSTFEFDLGGEPLLDVEVPDFSVEHFMVVMAEVFAK